MGQRIGFRDDGGTVESDGRAPYAATGMLTDHYELTMVDAALRSGVAGHRAVFECFTRRLPTGRRYGVLAGTGRLVEAIERFRFDDEALAWLAAQRFLAPETLAWLADYRFRGDVCGYEEGELFQADSPVLTVEGTFAEAVVLETIVLSILNYDSAVAAAGARMVGVAAGKTLIEAGSRRTSEQAAPAASRAAYLVGFAATSNLEAGRRYQVPTGGTTAHSFVLAHGDELAAFEAQVAVTGPATTLLVDTFDLADGIRNAVAAAGPELGAIRIDSGDPVVQARLARALLDELGARRTQIVVSGDLDEWSIERLVRLGAPVDRMLVGTQLVTGSGAPTAGFVYKLVAVADRPDGPARPDGSAGERAALRPVAKRSTGKPTRGGRKLAGRRLDVAGHAVAELVVQGEAAGALDAADVRRLQRPYVVGGEVVHRPDVATARAHHAAVRAELRAEHLALGAGEPAFPVRF